MVSARLKRIFAAGSLTSIAMSAGYADGAVLSRAFKHWTGATPTFYARQSRS